MLIFICLIGLKLKLIIFVGQQKLFLLNPVPVPHPALLTTLIYEEISLMRHKWGFCYMNQQGVRVWGLIK